MTLDERLARLERANRRLWAACGAMGLAGLLGAAGQRVPDVVKAHHFAVVNEKGELAADLGYDDGQAQLVLYDRGGTGRITAIVGAGGTAEVSVWGKAPKPDSAVLMYAEPGEPPAIQVRHAGAKKTIRSTDP
jgi:hypothetical protein